MDVINYSISGATDTVVDVVEYAFLGAAAADVFVAASAGNSGPTPSTVAHNSPWVTTVAASTHAMFENTVVLGNGATYKGASINGTPLSSKPLVISTAAGLPPATAEDVRLCAPGSLDPAKVTGKIVICDRGVFDRVAKSAAVKQAGGAGMVLTNTTPGSLDADFHGVPTVHVDQVAGAAIKTYVASITAPTAAFVIGNATTTPTLVPQIAGFSSRGPAIANDSDVIKPDISAPGVSVLAAVAPPSGQGRSFDLYSGTSMSSPHVAGLAAFILGKNPTWSPMTVKSAMMTTAGYTGVLDVAPSGLAKATTVQTSIATGEALERDVTVPAGTKVARFVADATNDEADLDLYVYRYNAAGTALEAVAGQSATGAADETVTLFEPLAAKYLVVVEGYAAAPGETTTATTYDEYLVGPTGLGNFVAEPDLVPVTQGETTSYDAVWSGLTTGRYLGIMEYEGALSPTYVTVTVGP